MSNKIRKIKPSEWRETEKWKAEVLFMCGISAARIADFARVSLTIGAIHRLIADRELQDQRVDYVRRLAALIRLNDTAPDGLTAFVPAVITKLALSSSISVPNKAFVSDGLRVAAKEADTRKRLIKDLKSHMTSQDHEPEKFVVMEKVGRQIVARNVANCPLEMLLSRGSIPQWSYDAGLRLRRDFDASTIGGLKAFNPMKDSVDGGFPANTISDGQSEAMERISEVRAAVSITCNDDDIATMWRILDGAVIQGRSVRQWAEFAASKKADGSFMPRKNRHIIWLLAGLEPVAFVYDLAPAGEVSNRLLSIKRAYGQLRKFVEKLNNA